MSQDDDLLADLAAGEKANMHARACAVCEHLSNMSPPIRTATERALQGTIGTETLAAILTRNGYPTGRRAVIAHRREDHTP